MLQKHSLAANASGVSFREKGCLDFLDCDSPSCKQISGGAGVLESALASMMTVDIGHTRLGHCKPGPQAGLLYNLEEKKKVRFRSIENASNVPVRQIKS